jgi:hypothetical protein
VESGVQQFGANYPRMQRVSCDARRGDALRQLDREQDVGEP